MTISNNDDVIDSRDIIARIQQIESEWLAEHEESHSECDCEFSPDMIADDDDRAEYDSLIKLRTDADWATEWHWGATLIRDSYFTDYVRELATDIGAVRDYEGNSWVVIDWEATAGNVQVDYSDLEFDGVTYWIRA